MGTTPAIQSAIRALGDEPLSESMVVEHLHPLFSRSLARNERTGEIYLANHSLGRPLDATGEAVTRALDAWYDELDGAWDQWIDARDSFRKRIASIIGCTQWDAVVPKTSAGQGLRAAINALPRRDGPPTIVATRGEFDSIDFILKAYEHKGSARIVWVDADDDGLLHSDDLIDAITDETDLVVCSMVGFVTGQWMVDLDRVVAATHRHDALMFVDAYHAFGTVPIDFEALNADFMVGGCYKYIRGGPGACFLAIHPKHLSGDGGVPDKDGLFTTDTGWFAKQDTFGYTRSDAPAFAPGGDAWLESTPPAIVYAQANPGLELVEGIGVGRLRDYSLAQQDHLRDALRGHGVEARVLAHRGAFVLIPSETGTEAIAALKAQGVNADGRPCPKTGRFMVRLCPDLLNTQAELSEAARRIGKAMGSGG
jgi:kynureninase